MSEPVLCYVDGAWAYFTTQSLDKQWGDDWNDAPYEHNAGTPYYDYENISKPKEPRWRIIKVAFDGGLSTPGGGEMNSSYSVEQINRHEIAWLRDRWGNSGIVIHAGTPLSEFKALIRKAGGAVYTEDM